MKDSSKKYFETSLKFNIGGIKIENKSIFVSPLVLVNGSNIKLNNIKLCKYVNYKNNCLLIFTKNCISN